jgi:hypothetical protein
MRELWPLVLGFGVIVLLLGILRARPGRRRQERGLAIPKVEGFQVTGPLHPRMTRGCVFDLGLQYGRGFRRKEGPALPHGPNCECRAVPFAFSGQEVFSGSLRRFAEIRCSMPGFPPEACRPLLEGLRRVNAEPVPGTLTEYLGRVGLLESLPPHQREPVLRFLEDRYAYLCDPRPAPAADGAVPSAPQPSDAV